jgi:hypothetical protein
MLYSEGITLKTVVAGLKTAHLTKITLAFDFFGAHPDGARVQASEKFKILCAFEHLLHFVRRSCDF